MDLLVADLYCSLVPKDSSLKGIAFGADQAAVGVGLGYGHRTGCCFGEGVEELASPAGEQGRCSFVELRLMIRDSYSLAEPLEGFVACSSIEPC